MVDFIDALVNGVCFPYVKIIGGTTFVFLIIAIYAIIVKIIRVIEQQDW